MISFLFLTLLVLVFGRLLQIWLKYKFHPIPSFPFSLQKAQNAKDLAEAFKKGNLPKIFRPELYPFSTYRNGL